MMIWCIYYFVDLLTIKVMKANVWVFCLFLCAVVWCKTTLSDLSSDLSFLGWNVWLRERGKRCTIVDTYSQVVPCEMIKFWHCPGETWVSSSSLWDNRLTAGETTGSLMVRQTGSLLAEAILPPYWWDRQTHHVRSHHLVLRLGVDMHHAWVAIGDSLAIRVLWKRVCIF